jgi:ribbon-helix-helix CopG family protein
MSPAYMWTMRTTIRLPEDLLRRAKRKAAAEGRTLTALIEDGLRSVVDERPKPTRRRRVALPVSKAKGWLKPGMDLTRFSDYQEMEDLEYVERLQNIR